MEMPENQDNETFDQDAVPESAVSVYNAENDGLDDFPVLKAFQQYIDAEQQKARRRVLMLCVSFGISLIVIISLFVALLIGISMRNQNLSDRLLEYALRNQASAERTPAVQVAPAASSSGESAALAALTAKLEEMQRKMEDGQRRAEQTAAEATERIERVAREERAKLEKERASVEQQKRPAVQEKAESPEAVEIRHLKALLAAEKEKNAIKKDLQRQMELEEYRRKHYPELYRNDKSGTGQKAFADKDDDIDALLKEVDAIRYFEDESDETNKNDSVKAPLPSAARKESQTPVSTESGWTVP